MTLSRRELIAYEVAGAATSLTMGTTRSETAAQEEAKRGAAPPQVSTDRCPANCGGPDVFRGCEMRSDLSEVAHVRAKSH